MSFRTLNQIILSLFLSAQWSLPALAQTDLTLTASEVENSTSEPMTVTIEYQKPLDLTLPASFHKNHRFQEPDLSQPIKNSSRSSQINAINNKTPLISLPMEFDHSDLLLGGLATTAMLAITVTDSEVKILKHTQNRKSPRNDRIMNFGRRFGEDDYAKVVIGGSLVWALVTDENKKFKEIIPVELEAIFAAGLANNLLKILFKRALPTESPNDPYRTSTSNRPPDHGIPSGHTTSAIVLATIAAHNLENLGPMIPAILYTAAAITGVSRIYHNQHWATDVLASVYSYYLTKAILNKDKNKNSKHHLVVMPLIDPRTRSFGMYAQVNLQPEVTKPCGEKLSGLERVTACVREATKK